MVRTICDQPDAAEVNAQFARVVAALEAKPPNAAEHLVHAREQLLAFTAFPREAWTQIWSNNPQELLKRDIRRRTEVVGILPDQPGRRAPSGRRARRTKRRMDRATPLHGTGRGEQ